MTMTKKEQAEMDRLRLDRDIARALRWPEYPMPEPMTFEEIQGARTVEVPYRYGSGSTEFVAVGWFQNAYGRTLTRGCSDGHSHNPNGLRISMQGAGRMYRTRREAAIAMRIELTELYGEQLAAIDATIAAGEEP